MLCNTSALFALAQRDLMPSARGSKRGVEERRAPERLEGMSRRFLVALRRLLQLEVPPVRERRLAPRDFPIARAA